MLTPKLSTSPNLPQTGSDSVKLRTPHKRFKKKKNIDLNFISIKQQSVKVSNINSESNKWVCETQHSQKEFGL